MGWLRHAFAVRPEGAERLSPSDEALVERFCQAIVRRRLTAAAMVALETVRPLSGLAAQGIYFFTPLASLLISPADMEQLADFLQRPDAVEILCQRLETLEANQRLERLEANQRLEHREADSPGSKVPRDASADECV